MLDNFRFQVANLATEDRMRDLQERRAAVLGTRARIFRLGGDRSDARQVGRR